MVTTPSFYNLKDQGIYAAGDFFISQERYRAAPYNASQPNNPDEVPAGIPTVYQPQGGGGGGGYTGGVNDLITDYNRTTKDRYFRNQDTPLVDDLYQSKLDKNFMGFPSYREQELTGPDLGEYIGTNTDVPLELTTAGKIQQGLGSFKDKVGSAIGTLSGFGPIGMALNAMDRFDTLSPADRQFIEMNMGYIGPTVFGENTSGLSKDPYGINTRSALGNYADYVEDYNTDYTEEELAEMSKFRQQKIAYYKEKQKELKEIKEQKEAEARAEAQAIQDRNRAEGTGGYQAGYGSDFMEGREGASEGLGASDKGGSDTMGSSKDGGIIGYGGTSGTPRYQQFMDGGLADMLEIYD